MAETLHPGLIREIRRYGAVDINACFNCGNCTAVCQLSSQASNFPRRVIRYGQVGMRDRLLADADLWMCYNCGDCTSTCPRQADPAQFMSAARRYAIAHYDPTGLARLYYGSALSRMFLLTVLSAIFALWLLWHRTAVQGDRLALFDFIPGPVIHDVGVGIFMVIGLAAATGIAAMIYRTVNKGGASGCRGWRGWRAVAAAASFAVKESLGQMRYQRCDEQKTDQPWYGRPWLVHATILWGFLAMLTATTLDFLFKPIGSYIPPWHPVRLLGMVGGLVCLYGLSIVLYRRLSKKTAAQQVSRFDDWFFPLLLAATVITGLITEVVVYLPPSWFSYSVFLVHVVLAMDLVALLPITKFAHALYRPLALGLTHWARAPVVKPVPSGEGARA